MKRTKRKRMKLMVIKRIIAVVKYIYPKLTHWGRNYPIFTVSECNTYRYEMIYIRMKFKQMLIRNEIHVEGNLGRYLLWENNSRQVRSRIWLLVTYVCYRLILYILTDQSGSWIQILDSKVDIKITHNLIIYCATRVYFIV